MAKFRFTKLRLAAEVIGQSILHDQCPTWDNHLAVCDAVGNAEQQTADLLAALEAVILHTPQGEHDWDNAKRRPLLYALGKCREATTEALARVREGSVT